MSNNKEDNMFRNINDRDGNKEKRSRKRGYGLSGFESWGGYMAAKTAKLQQQFQNEAGERNKGIFSGVAIFVNGYTEPTAEELKRIMIAHDGVYHHYYSSSQTTHIIASNLPDSKIKNSNQIDKIVSPKWVVDSLESGKLLDYKKYLLYSAQTSSQSKLPFKSVVSSAKPKDMCSSMVSYKEESPVKTELTGKFHVASNEIELPVVADHFSGTAASGYITTKQSVPSEKLKKEDLLSTANPAFLSEFYNNSRLHHISTMAATFKDYVNKLQNGVKVFPGREHLKKWVVQHREGKLQKTENVEGKK